MTFEEEMIQRVQNALLEQIRSCRFIEHHHIDRKSVPQDIVQKAWDGLDWEGILQEVSEQLNKQVVSLIVNNMITETKTDVKKLLAVQEVREQLRLKAYPKILEVLEGNQ